MITNPNAPFLDKFPYKITLSVRVTDALQIVQLYVF